MVEVAVVVGWSLQEEKVYVRPWPQKNANEDAKRRRSGTA